MSYEGTTEKICSKGHYAAYDAMTEMYFGEINFCSCGEPYVWQHEIDQTNGYDENNPSTYEAKLKEISYEVQWHKDFLGKDYATKTPLYAPDDPEEWYELKIPDTQPEG